MKTTIEIPDSLMAEARKVATQDGTTVRSLVEQGLRRVIAERKQTGGFRLRKATFKGNGLQPGTVGVNWEHVRDLVYQGRGG